MKLQDLFTPRLNKKKQEAYKNKELERRIRELTEAGYESIEFKNKVYQAKKELDREIKNGIFRKYYKPTARHKKVFHNHILKYNLLPLFNTSENIHYQLPVSIKTDSQFTTHISKQNLFSTVFPEFKRFDEGNRQPCIFTKNNVGWISKDKDGYYRYCSKSINTGVIYGFSLLDLIEIAYAGEFVGTDMAYQIARKWLATTLNVSYRDFDYVNQQKAKYESNLAFIDNALEWESLYPNLFAIIESQLYVLVELLDFASKHIMERRHTIKKEAVFFVSNRKLRDIYKEKHKEKYSVEKKTSHSTIASAINLLCTLGFLHKIPSETINHKEELLQIAKSIQRDKKHHKINFMTIPHYDCETLRKAEKTAKRLRRFEITTAKNITNETLKRALGEKKANVIINVREVSLMRMHPDKLQKIAEEEFEEYPWEAFEQSQEKPLKELEKENSYYIFDSPLFKMSEDELYERSLWHFEQHEEDNELE